MLINDTILIGNRLYRYRKNKNMTQMEMAEASGLSDRAYANIERGSANMRLETLIRICEALKITPNDLLLTNDKMQTDNDSLLQTIERLNNLSQKEKETALSLVAVYLNSLQ